VHRTPAPPPGEQRHAGEPDGALDPESLMEEEDAVA
jgi:hypothetical protein